jgi:large subunit ribosomal protein L25
VRVPLTTEGRAKGVVQGGELRVNYRTLPIVAKPGLIPASIVVDVTELEIHQSARVKDLKLPEGVRVALPAEQAVVGVATERKLIEEEATAVPGAATPVAAAPAAAAKAPAAKK